MTCRRLLSWCCSAFALVGPLASHGFALPMYKLKTTYYSDDNYQHRVGSSTLTCSGQNSESGEYSEFFVERFELCPPRHGIPEISCYVDGVLTTCPPNICDPQIFICS
jgi:hypothetical protein